MNHRVKAVGYQNLYRLIVTFSDGETREFDLVPYLHYPIFEKLKDESFCKTAFVKYDTVTWSDEIDFDPDTLYLDGKGLISA